MPIRNSRRRSASRPALRARSSFCDSTAQDGLDHAGKLGDQTVTPGVGHPATVALDQTGQGIAVLLEDLQRADLVAIHEAAVTLDISAENGRQLALDGRRHALASMCGAWSGLERLPQPAGRAELVPPPRALRLPAGTAIATIAQPMHRVESSGWLHHRVDQATALPSPALPCSGMLVAMSVLATARLATNCMHGSGTRISSSSPA